MKKLVLWLPALLAGAYSANGQVFVKNAGPAPTTVCYASAEDQHSRLPLPAAFVQQKNTGQRRAGAARIEVTYSGFTPQAQAAFQYAVDIWQSLLTSPVTIRVQATWTPLGAGVLGSAGATAYYSDISSSVRNGAAYPVALAEKLSGRDLNPATEADISARFSSSFNWYYGTDGNVPTGQYDLVSVVLHELGHGLGFIASTGYSNGQGGYATPPSVFGTYIENLNNEPLINNPTYPNSSKALGTQFTSAQVYFNSALAKSVNGGVRPRLYAPSTYSAGSSISHLNESTYPATNINSLMTPQIGASEAMHNPGPITLKMFAEMGWFNTAIRHTPLPDTETAQDFPITALVESDGTITPGSVKLNYKIDNGALTTVAMAAVVGNQYQAVIPNPGLNHTVSYYLTAADNETGRTYTAPAQYQPILNKADVYSFVVGPDQTAPIVRHRAPTYVFADQLPYQFVVQATDNLGVASVTMEYAVNGTSRPALTLTRQGTSSTYTGLLSTAAGALTAGDVVTYRLVTRDAAKTTNQTLTPASGTQTVNIVSFKPAQASYLNTFNSTGPLDFVGEGFQIAQPDNFTNPAIHSVHPYTNDSTLIYQMLVPIRMTDADVLLTFDEVVLAEPGEAGSPYGSPDFYDYVVVEGSADKGLTWKPLADGYDSRLQTDWLAAWNAQLTADGNSTAAGSASLYKPHSFNLRSVFQRGDEVRLRFRLYADAGANGWGWAIDNVNVQTVITSTAAQLQKAGGLSLYPNPTTGRFTLKATLPAATAGLELLVRNSLGQVVYRQPVAAPGGQVNAAVDLTHLTSGLYQVSLGTPADAAFRKVLIQR
ncbi:T9SS type A sorting domain-containing protein [Hymenobacter pini]|uniref:T9SS type A sorting domain-containing protein n=1 Tax=Hymenobacter pini TaxID=2880879 RepID=UPI001CF2F5D3|nr:T9SS type A sorting domain-containing protein [Hymenobacter pini]MCA8832695.1 T9SS type A sorting domain-containing protein [Hymenobacter pini]